MFDKQSFEQRMQRPEYLDKILNTTDGTKKCKNKKKAKKFTELLQNETFINLNNLPQTKHTGEKMELKLPKEKPTREVLIVRQNVLSHATKLVCEFETKNTTNTLETLANKVIETAKILEKYVLN